MINIKKNTKSLSIKVLCAVSSVQRYQQTNKLYHESCHSTKRGMRWRSSEQKYAVRATPPQRIGCRCSRRGKKKEKIVSKEIRLIPLTLTLIHIDSMHSTPKRKKKPGPDSPTKIASQGYKKQKQNKTISTANCKTYSLQNSILVVSRFKNHTNTQEGVKSESL